MASTGGLRALLDFQQQVSASADQLRAAVVATEQINRLAHRFRGMVIFPANPDHADLCIGATG